MIDFAVMREPCARYAMGLTQAELGEPDLELARAQHRAYAEALERLGIGVLILPANDAFPDSCFVEDCAVIAGDVLIWTRPGAESRRGEIALLRDELRLDFASVELTNGILDGGDVCQIEDRFLIGLSERTDEEGAGGLGAVLKTLGYRSQVVDIRQSTLLHLKSGLSYLGNEIVLVSNVLRGHPALQGLRKVVPEDGEEYAANAVSFGNGVVFLPAGFPRVAAAVRGQGFEVIELQMSEFQKMDGGLTCLSLRFGS